MEMDYKDIGKRVKRERDGSGMTQEKLAELVNISVTHMSNIENGNTKLSLPVLMDIANALGCDADALLFGNLNNNKNAAAVYLSNLLEDCTQSERVIIIDTIQSLKDSLTRSRKED